jgi:transmembrane 9 superfamily protein 2/4
MVIRILVLAFAALFCYSHAYYLPGVAPVNFDQGEAVSLKVNKLTSVHTQLPYKYYSLPWDKSCVPDPIVDNAENLGEILRGDRIENSNYMVISFILFTNLLLLYIDKCWCQCYL